MDPVRYRPNATKIRSQDHMLPPFAVLHCMFRLHMPSNMTFSKGCGPNEPYMQKLCDRMWSQSARKHYASEISNQKLS